MFGVKTSLGAHRLQLMLVNVTVKVQVRLPYDLRN